MNLSVNEERILQAIVETYEARRISVPDVFGDNPLLFTIPVQTQLQLNKLPDFSDKELDFFIHSLHNKHLLSLDFDTATFTLTADGISTLQELQERKRQEVTLAKETKSHSLDEKKYFWIGALVTLITSMLVEYGPTLLKTLQRLLR